MDAPPRTRIVLLVWGLAAAFQAITQLLTFVLTPPLGPVSVWAVVWSHLSFSLAWALLTRPLFLFAGRFPPRRLREPRVAAAHLASALLVPALVVVMVYFLFSLGTGEVFRRRLQIGEELHVILTAGYYPVQAIVYLEVLAVAWAVVAAGTAGRAEARASRLAGQLAAARVTSLRTQLHPHFLFNTLNSLMPLIGTRPEEAERTLRKLGDLFRVSLASDGTSTSLRAEIDFVSRYLDIQRTRYGARLTTAVHLDPLLAGAEVPPLILQPLVENAIRHGLAPRPGPGSLEVRASRRGQVLVLEVLDDGLGLATPPPPPKGSGLGLGNTRRRLAHLYGDAQRLVVSGRPEGGASARIEIPFRLHGEPAA